MVKRNLRLFSTMNMLVDMVIVFASYIFASFFWLEIVRKSDNMASWRDSIPLLAAAVYALVFWLIISFLGMYNTDRLYRLRRKLSMIVFSNAGTLILVSAALYALHLQEFSRGVVACFYVLSTGLLCAKYTAMRLLSNRLRARGLNLKHVLIVGTGHLARQYAEDVCADEKLGYRLGGYVGVPDAALNAKVLCGFDELDALLLRSDYDDVVIALDSDETVYIKDIILACEKNGMKYSIIPFYNDLIPTHPMIDSVGRSKLINLRRNRLENLGWATVKRSFDIFVSTLGLIILSPLFLLLAIGVKLSSPGPVLFRQERVGFRRKNFVMLKFRSMRVNPRQNSGWTVDDDPRKTRFGSFIRKCSLDELPQLWNVLKGDMSLIGPRPELPHFVEQFRESVPLYMVKHQVRPGITGWAQVNGYRGDTSIARRIECDIWYIENWSVWLDIRILFRTVFGGMVNQEAIVLDKEKAHSI